MHTKEKCKYRIDKNSVKIFKVLPKDSIQSNKALVIVNNTFYGKEGEARAIRIVQTHNSFDGLLEACKDAVLNKDFLLPNSTITLLKSAIAKAEDK